MYVHVHTCFAMGGDPMCLIVTCWGYREILFRSKRTGLTRCKTINDIFLNSSTFRTGEQKGWSNHTLCLCLIRISESVQFQRTHLHLTASAVYMRTISPLDRLFDLALCCFMTSIGGNDCRGHVHNLRNILSLICIWYPTFRWQAQCYPRTINEYINAWVLLN